ncbi:type I secretion C-terminal target domain-containing protein, partial [Candidatus Sororendozoicomonas aggregata]|uniref:type I secretion C-terminal target domain-containing protein n=1 Tax=Candidatus Sororendozoicomonas aggregata TaxID=3073239 RepID=UPI002ED6A66D
SDLQLTAVGDDVLTTFVAADDDGTGIYSQLYGDDGAVLTDPMLINDTSAGDQSMPAVTALSDGTVKIVWSSDHSGNDDVYSKTLALGHVVGESAEPGTLVGKARATDPEGDALTFSLVDDAGGRFAIDPQTGEITVAGALDYAVAPSHALTVRVTDSSGNVTDQATIIRVAEINHTPDAEDNSLTMQGSSSYSFSADDFHFSDADMADSLRSVTITSLPTIGTLALNGVAVTANQVIAAEDIPNLTFTTPFSQSAGNDQFGFTVSDGAASSAIQTFTLDVQAVNVSGNLLTNASAGSFNSGWSVPSDANAWGFSSNSHDGNSRSWTTSSNTFAKKSQTLDLLAKGFDPDYLDTAPDINISDWFKNNGVSSNQFYMKVEIRDADHNVLASYDSGVLNSGSSWGEESHIFQNYGAGARYIYFEHGGNNIGSSSGNYGTMIDDSEIVVALESGSDMTGTGGSEILVGTANSDTIKGEAGSDKLLGNAGDDLIQGGAGDDTLTGGSGSDTFTWMTADLGSAQSPAEDVITDFQLGQGGDVINLKDVMQNGNHSPEQHLALSFENGNTLLEIKPQANGGVTQRIKLEGVDLSSLGNSDAEIINNLIYQGNLQLEENEAPVFVTQSLSLDGTAGDYAEIGTVNANSARPFPTTATTVEMWLQPDIAGNNVQTPFTYEVGSTDALQVILRPDLGKAVIWIDHAGYVVDVPALFDGGWHHLSFSWDSASGELKIYLDGQLEDTGTHKQGDSIGTGGGLVLGQEADSQMGGYNGSQAFAGKMRDFRIWNDVRDQAEIEANMDSGGTLDAEAQGLVSHYLLNGDANDRGPGGNHLTVTGASWVASDDPADNDLYQIIEDAQQGTEVGRAQVTDADGDVLTYSLVDDAGGRFAIDPQTGVITVAGALDYAVASSHSVTVRVTDSLGGYADQVTTINVAQLNQTPDAEDNSLLMQGSGSYSFSVDDFHFSDADMADSLQSVTITTLPSTGALTLNGSAVTANQVIAASDIPNLTYTAPVSASAVSGQFEFTVSDGKASSSVQTITLEVQPSGSGLTGTTESEIIIGTASSDTIKGEEGSDKLLGNAGDDLIYGGAGDDTLTGGSGSDTFAWTAADLGSAQSPAEDVITDFQVGQGGDVIDLSGVMLSNVNSPEQHIALSFENGNTILEIKPQANGDVTQRIKLEGVDLSSLGNTDADIINNLLGTRNLQLEENEAPVFELTPDSSLVTVLNFAEGDGSSSGDLTGQGHDASLGNGAQWTNEGVNLNGTGGNLGDLQFGGDFTLATTFTYNSHHGWARIVDLGNGSASDNIVIGSPSLGRIEAHVFRGNSTKVVGFDNFYTVG